MSTLNQFDYLLIAVLAISLLQGLWRGLIRELVALLTWVAAALLAWRFGDMAAAWLSNYVHSPTTAQIIGVVVIFIVVLLVGTVIAALVAKIPGEFTLGFVGRLCGGLLGLLRGAVIGGLIVVVIGKTPLAHQAWFRQSQITHEVQALVATQGATQYDDIGETG